MSTLISSLLLEGRLALEQCGFELHGFIYMQIFLLVNSICAVLRHSAVSRLFATPWTVACQAPLSRQEYWRGLPFPPPGEGSSQPRDSTCVSCIGRQILTTAVPGEPSKYSDTVQLEVGCIFGYGTADLGS